MSNPAPSSHPGREPQPVNPYAASREAEPQEPSNRLLSENQLATRQFQARMDWSDRRNFLRSIGPARLTAICCAIVWLISMLKLIRDWTLFFIHDTLRSWTDVAFALVSLSGLVQYVLAFYVCWLAWRYADLLREVAGGATTDMGSWSRLHYRIGWIVALWFSLQLATELFLGILPEAPQS
jgi:hypothetical protein